MKKRKKPLMKPQAQFLLQNTLLGFMVMKTLNVGLVTCKELHMGSSQDQGAILDINIFRTCSRQEHSRLTVVLASVVVVAVAVILRLLQHFLHRI